MACKKYEKICFDNGSVDKLEMVDDMSGKPEDYKQYIKTFKWNQRKYNQKQPLKELCDAFLKTLQTNDAHIKKFVDELSGKKSKLQMMTKKEGNTLMVRDYTDDIYTSNKLSIQNFLEGKTQKYGSASEVFANMLIVVPKTKLHGLADDLKLAMSDYYKTIDESEDKRITDMARLKLQEVRDMPEADRKEFLSHLKLAAMPVEPKDLEDFKNQPKEVQEEHNSQKEKYRKDNEAWEKLAVAQIEAHVIMAQLKEKRAQRMPYCIVPDAPFDCEIKDKENNSVYRIIVYKPQAEDVIKALRKRGYTPRLFAYNKTAWEEENKERSLLSEQVQNATTQLNKVAVAAYQQLFTALIHLKVVRAYIDGVLRFGIPPKFFIGVVMPRKGAERTVLTDMMNVLADEKLKDMYGEKQDAQESEDYWPFVCVHLTSPNFMHGQKE